jgi:hypothetical protein
LRRGRIRTRQGGGGMEEKEKEEPDKLGNNPYY